MVPIIRPVTFAVWQLTMEVQTYVLECSGKFGEYGIIGFAALDHVHGQLLDFFMSCRVQRKCVEQAFFSHLFIELRKLAFAQIAVRVRPTKRNAASFRMLHDLGFSQIGEDLWHQHVSTVLPNSDVVRVLTRQFA